MSHALEFLWVKFSDFKTFTGEHKVTLALDPGLYFWTGKNKAEPQMGANGVGKSTVFDALFWCFWGKTIKDSRPANAVVPWNDAKAAPAAMVRFRRDGVSMTLIRTRKPNKLVIRTTPTKNGKRIETFDREIQQEDVSGILGMNEETFRRTILIGQFGTMFLDLKPEAQSAMFSDALELDRWLRAAKLAGAKATVQEDLLIATDKTITGAEARIEELRTQRAEAKEEAEAWEVEHARAATKAAKAVDAAQASLDALEAKPAAKSVLAARLQGVRDAKRAAGADARAAVKRCDAKLNQSRGAALVLVTELKGLRDKLTQLDEGTKDKTCPSCGQKVSGKHLAKEVAAVIAEVENTQEAITAANEIVAADREKKVTAEALVTAIEEEIENLGDQVAEAEKAHTEWKGQRDTARAELDAAKAALRRVKNDENPHTETDARLLERINKIKESLKESRAARTVAEQAAGSYKYWANAFKEIRLGLIDEVLKELEVASAAHAERLGLVDWDIKFQTERENKSGDTSYGFNVLLFPPGQKDPVRWESYSGGEDRRWQLAVTFGLSEVLLARAGLTSNLEVLDEPAQHMSPEGVESLLESLADRAKENGKTIFYVDHQSLDRGYFDGIFTVVRDKEGSRVQ